MMRTDQGSFNLPIGEGNITEQSTGVDLASYVGEEPGIYTTPGGESKKYYGEPGKDMIKEGTQEYIDTRDESDETLEEKRRKRLADSPAGMKKQKSPIEMKTRTGFKMKGNPYKMGKMQTASAVKMAKEAMAKMKKENSAMEMGHKSPAKAAKPDFPDIDGDGNTTESMKQAAADKKAGPNKLKKATKAERAEMAKGDKKMTPEMMEAIKKRGKEMKGKTPGTGMRKMSAADRKELENLGKKSGTKMKKEDSPNKLKKPTRKMDTAEEAPKMKAEGKAVAKMKKEDSPNKKYKSAAQRKAVHASKADGGKGNPNKMKKESPAKQKMEKVPSLGLKPMDMKPYKEAAEGRQLINMEKRKRERMMKMAKENPEMFFETFGQSPSEYLSSLPYG